MYYLRLINLSDYMKSTGRSRWTITL